MEAVEAILEGWNTSAFALVISSILPLSILLKPGDVDGLNKNRG